MKCLDLVDRHRRVDGICKSIVHTLDSLGARRRCLCHAKGLLFTLNICVF